MPRGPVYTPEEDAILMAHKSVADIIAALQAAGYSRPVDSIRQRKKLLRSRVDAGTLFKQREQLLYDYRALQRQREALEQQLVDVNLAIYAAANEQPIEELDDEERAVVIARVTEKLRDEDLRARQLQAEPPSTDR